MDTSPAAPASGTAIPPGTAIRRHGLGTRIWHWINAVAVIVLLGSGLGI